MPFYLLHMANRHKIHSRFPQNTKLTQYPHSNFSGKFNRGRRGYLGILILIMPRPLNFIAAIYLIVIGLVGLTRW